jgi:hypothetical protein
MAMLQQVCKEKLRANTEAESQETGSATNRVITTQAMGFLFVPTLHQDVACMTS